MRQLAVRPEETIMVGDSIADSRAAAAAGCRFICVRYGYHRQNRPPPADANAERFADLLHLVPRG